jgi:hypothetical protein
MSIFSGRFGSVSRMLRSIVFRSVTAILPLMVLASALFFPTQASAQVSGASLSGSIADTSGGAVPNAKVTIANTATGVTRDATTDAAGFFSAPNLLPGPYAVTVSAAGFATTKSSDITLTVGSNQVLNVSLKVGGVNETINVTGGAPLVQLSDSTIKSEVGSTTIRELPLNGRDWTSLATLSPGVNAIEAQIPFDGSQGRGNRGFGAQMTISGGRPTQNNYRLDGNSINDYAGSGPGSVTGVQLGVDAIEEFSVLTGNFSAEYGKTSAGVINAISKSGTNAFHGDVYEFLRNQKLDANDFFLNASGQPKPAYRRNQFGAAAGGPIRKNKTFIFFDYEGIRQNQGVAVSTIVPSDAARSGHLADGTVVIVPPIIQKYLGLYPHANGPVNGDQGTFTSSEARVVSENFYTVRGDHRFSDRDSMFATYQYDRAPYTQPDQFHDENITTSTARHIAALEENHIFGPNLINTARIGFNRESVANADVSSAINPLVADPSLGVFPGANNPVTDIAGGFSTLNGGVGSSYTRFYWTDYQLNDDAFLTRGTHSLKFGFNVENMRYGFTQYNQPSGVLRFANLQGFLTNSPVSLLGGTPSRQDFRGTRQTIYAGYVQDDWRVRKNLTLNVGLRYEMATVLSEEHGKLTNLANISDPRPYCGTLDPSLTTVFGQGFCTGVAPLYKNPTRLNFEPRLGFAWDPKGDGKTAVRGGFSIFDILPLPGYFFTIQSSTAPFSLTGVATGLTSANGLGVLASDPNSAYNKIGSNSFTGAYMDENPKRNYVEQWNINVQRQITSTLTATVGYIGSHGVHMMMRGDDGDDVYATHTSAGWLWPNNPTGADLRVNPNFGAIRFMTYNSSSRYNGLVINVQKQMSHGFQFGGSYTWSKSMDNDSATLAGDSFSNSVTSWFPWAPSISWAPSDFNVTHAASINGIWAVPSFKSGILKAVLGGWELGSIVKMNSGIPTTPLIGGDALKVQNVGTDPFSIPSLIAGCNPVNSNFKSNPGGVFLGYINASCYTLPQATPAIAAQCLPFLGTGTLANPQFPGTCSNLLGNAGRNSIYGPQLYNVDMSLFRNIPVKKISEAFTVQFRAEFFNILNHYNFGPPLPFFGSGQAQIFNSTGALTHGGGLQYGVTQPRDIQFALKLIW